MKQSLITPEIKKIIKKEYSKIQSIRKVRENINDLLNIDLTFHNIRDCLNVEPIKSDLHSIINEDRKEIKERREQKNINNKYKELLIKIDDLENQIDIITQAKEHKPKKLEIKPTTKKSEATAVILASDWHLEEVINPETVNYLNEYNPTIAEQRAKNFFKNSLRLTNIMSKEVKLENMLLALL
jgi:hypothetical protein